MSDVSSTGVTAEVRLERLSPAETEARLAEHSLVYLPLGTIEFHGPHLPLGLDAMTAHGVCVAAARAGGGVVMPAVHQGFGGGHGLYPWTIMMPDGQGIADHLRATLQRLEGLGTRTAVIFSGHFAPEQLEMIDELEESWNAREYARLRVVATAINRNGSAPLPPDHAGRFESTLLAAIDPELVHLEHLPPAQEFPADDPGGDAYGEHRHDESHPLWGVFGPDPRATDPAEAPKLLQLFATWLSDLARHGGSR